MTQRIQCGALNVFDFVADVQKSQAYFTFRSDSAHVSSWQNQEIPVLSLDQLLQCMIPLLAQSGHGDRRLGPIGCSAANPAALSVTIDLQPKRDRVAPVTWFPSSCRALSTRMHSLRLALARWLQYQRTTIER